MTKIGILLGFRDFTGILMVSEPPILCLWVYETHQLVIYIYIHIYISAINPIVNHYSLVPHLTVSCRLPEIGDINNPTLHGISSNIGQ